MLDNIDMQQVHQSNKICWLSVFVLKRFLNKQNPDSSKSSLVRPMIWLKGSFHQNTKQKHLLIVEAEGLRLPCVFCFGFNFSEEEENSQETQQSSPVSTHLLSHADCPSLSQISFQKFFRLVSSRSVKKVKRFIKRRPRRGQSFQTQ